MNELLIKNAKIVTHEKTFEGSVLIHGKTIKKIIEGPANEVDKSAGVEAAGARVLDLKGKHLLPGLIDVHVHFRTPGQEYKEDWETGSKAALAGGVTTVLDMPNNDPPVTDEKALRNKREIVQKHSLVNYGFFIGATPDNIDKLNSIKGVAGIKVYMGSSTGNLLLKDKDLLEKLIESTSKLIAVHAENEDCIRNNFLKYKSHTNPKVHSMIRGPECAYEAVKLAVHLAKKYKKKLHICHLSTEKELATARKFRDEVSVEVTPHHLFLTSMDYERFGNTVKVNPPLRDPADQIALWQGIKEDIVDVVATDHAPHTADEKKQNFDEVPSGIPGIQTCLPLLLNAVNNGKLTLEKVVELTSFNPARIFSIKNKGDIKEGMDADLTVVDIDLSRKVDRKYLFSKCGWSPFEGWDLKGWPVAAIVGGKVMYEWRDKFGTKLGREVEYVE